MTTTPETSKSILFSCSGQLFDARAVLDEGIRSECAAYLTGLNTGELGLDEALMVLAARAKLSRPLNYEDIPVLTPFAPYVDSILWDGKAIPSTYLSLKDLFAFAGRFERVKAFFSNHSFQVPEPPVFSSIDDFKGYLLKLEEVSRCHGLIDEQMPNLTKLGLVELHAEFSAEFRELCLQGGSDGDLGALLKDLWDRLDKQIRAYQGARMTVTAKRPQGEVQCGQIVEAARAYIPKLFDGGNEPSAADVRQAILDMPNSPAFLAAVEAYMDSTVTPAQRDAISRMPSLDEQIKNRGPWQF